jgi:hypothetical protein
VNDNSTSAIIADLTLLGLQPATEAPETAQPQAVPDVGEDLTVEQLVERLDGIKTRMFWLLAVFATTLSRECLSEMEARRSQFQVLATTLRERDPEKLQQITEGHETFLMTSTAAVRKPCIPFHIQEQEHFRFWLSTLPKPRPPKSDGFGDGLGQFIS